jgi:hypothetical protein
MTVATMAAGGELIDAAIAKRGCAGLYWTTKRQRRGTALYDRIARFNGFIRYDYALD